MPLPPTYDAVFSYPAFPLSSRPPGVYQTDTLYGGTSIDGVALWAYVGGMVGPGSLTCALECSVDGVTWTTIPGSAPAALTGVGSSNGYAAIPAGCLARVTATVEGSAITCQVLAVISIPSGD